MRIRKNLRPTAPSSTTTASSNDVTSTSSGPLTSSSTPATTNPITRPSPSALVCVLSQSPWDASHQVQTKDGYLLGHQRVAARSGDLKVQKGPPVLLLHGIFTGVTVEFCRAVFGVPSC